MSAPDRDLTTTMHATSVAIDGRGVLITGESGAGKSDIGLQLIDRGAMLISDDYTCITRRADRLIATAPPNIAGMIEVRGLGIIEVAALPQCGIDLVVALDMPVERLPDPPQFHEILGIAVRLLSVSGKAASAPIVIERALQLLSAHE